MDFKNTLSSLRKKKLFNEGRRNHLSVDSADPNEEFCSMTKKFKRDEVQSKSYIKEQNSKYAIDEVADTFDHMKAQAISQGIVPEYSGSKRESMFNAQVPKTSQTKQVGIETQMDNNMLSTQFFEDSLIMGQIENAISSVNKNSSQIGEACIEQKTEENCDSAVFKVPKLIDSDKSQGGKPVNELNKTLSELLSHNDIDVIFDEIESSIYEMGDSQTNKTIAHEDVLEIICNSQIETEMDKSFFNTTLNSSFGSVLKNKLLANAAKSTTFNKPIILNASRISEEAVQNQKLGPFYGLPQKVKELIKLYKGIDDLYDWQDECLKLPAIDEKRNLIYALPTSGGKTLVAEILILRELLCYKKNALFILPFVAIVQEKYAPAIKAMDPDQLSGLVMEVIPKGSCLVFCASKRNCENVAKLLSKIVFKTLKEYKTEEKQQLIKSLKEETGNLCETLKFSIPFGIAYHHSGLTSEERRIIEDGFRAGIISVICCTSTLAAGVNLPAKRVILRSPYIGRDFINLSRYKQMVGRAGRAGLGEKGDSILICTEQELPKVIDLLKSPMDKAISTIHKNEGIGLRQLLLSCMALGIANTRTELQAVTKKTLWSVQNDDELEKKKLTDEIIKNLFNMGALQTDSHELNAEKLASNLSLKLETTINSEENIEASSIDKIKKRKLVIKKDSKLIVSKMGIAAIKGGLELSRAHILYEDLTKAQHSLVLLDALHLLYLVTPYDLSEQIKPDMSAYYTMFQRLPENERHTAKILGITESVAVKMMSNQSIKNVPERVLNRFYLTLILYDLWNEMPLYDAAEKYGVDRGLVQTLMQSAATFSSNVMNFCQELEEFWPFAHLLKGMCLRLSHCCTRELLPLMELPAVKQSRAKQLYNAGYKTLHSIAKANVGDLLRDIEYMSRQVAVQLISAAKMLLLEKVENLREEAEDVLNGIDNPNKFSEFNLSLIR